jgi:drug/metabolite transporter (DMT)-like permease
VQRSGAQPQLVSAAAERPLAVSADLVLLGTVLLWSFNFTAVKYAVTHGFTPLTYAPVRWGIAGAAFAAVTWRREGSLKVSRRDLLLLALLASVGVFLNQICFAYASRLATASTVALLFGTLPVFVALFSQFAGVERLRLRHWIAVAVSFSGVALVAAGASGRLSAHVGGVLLALATAATFAAFSVGIVPLLRRHSPYRINATTGLIGAVLLASTGSWKLAAQHWSMGALAWGALLYGALVSAALGNILWFKGIGRVGPGRAALYVNLQPFLGAVFALLVLSESLRPLQVAGGVVVGAAILIARVRPTPAPPAE